MMSQQQDEIDDKAYYTDRLSDIRGFLLTNKQTLNTYLDYCDAQGLEPDHVAYEMVQKIRVQIENVCDQYQVVLEKEASSLKQYSRKINKLSQLYRAATHLKVPATRALSWCSTAYNQSLDTVFFDPVAIGEAGGQFNYERTINNNIQKYEEQFLNVLGFDNSGARVLLTASGMSAYTLVESYLIQDILTAGDTVYIPRQIYGETEQILFRNRSLFRVVREDLRDADVIVKGILGLQPKVVILETMQNGLGTEIVDINKIISSLDKTVDYRQVHILLDDSLLTGAYNPFVVTNPNLKIYYIASAIKYLQLGMDISYAGIVAVKETEYEHLRRLRGFTGQHLPETSIITYPHLTREQYIARMKRMTRNAQIVAERINAEDSLKSYIQALYPEDTGELSFLGSLVTFKLSNSAPGATAMNLKPLYRIIEALIEFFKEQGVSLAHSESFGFSLPRINICGWCKDTPPYLRISCGDRSYAETVQFADNLVQGLMAHIDLMEKKSLQPLEISASEQDFCLIAR